jgi:hypothetical protein
VRYLVEEVKLDVNATNTAGYTAVMGAAWRGDNDVIRYLVSHGAKLDLRNERGWSATDLANGPFIRGSEVPLKHPDTITLLQELGGPSPISTPEEEEVLGGARRAGQAQSGEGQQQSEAEAGQRETQDRNKK